MDEIEKLTTLAFCAPEMVDLHRHQRISESVDIWALGVLLYKLAFFVTPFEDTNGCVHRMGILNAKWAPPQGHGYSQSLIDIIGCCLQENPDFRPNIHELLERCEEHPKWPRDGEKPTFQMFTHIGRVSKEIARRPSSSGLASESPLEQDQQQIRARRPSGDATAVTQHHRWKARRDNLQVRLNQLVGKSGLVTWITKATSYKAGAPKSKHVRKIILALWDIDEARPQELGQWGVRLFNAISQRPILTDSVVALKCALTVLRVFEEGPPKLLGSVQTFVPMLQRLYDQWHTKENESPDGSDSPASASINESLNHLVCDVLKVLISKIRFFGIAPTICDHFDGQYHPIVNLGRNDGIHHGSVGGLEHNVRVEVAGFLISMLSQTRMAVGEAVRIGKRSTSMQAVSSVPGFQGTSGKPDKKDSKKAKLPEDEVMALGVVVPVIQELFLQCKGIATVLCGLSSSNPMVGVIKQQLQDNLATIKSLRTEAGALSNLELKDRIPHFPDEWKNLISLSDTGKNIGIKAVEEAIVKPLPWVNEPLPKMKSLDTEDVEDQLRHVMCLPGNDRCVECHVKGPTWASINLGVLFCFNCSKVHRGLGTHITQVKSVNLDKWKLEWVAKIKQVGNTRSNSYFESSMPIGMKPEGQSKGDAHLAWFVRAKYDKKSWCPTLEDTNNVAEEGTSPNANWPVTSPLERGSSRNVLSGVTQGNEASNIADIEAMFIPIPVVEDENGEVIDNGDDIASKTAIHGTEDFASAFPSEHPPASFQTQEPSTNEMSAFFTSLANTSTVDNKNIIIEEEENDEMEDVFSKAAAKLPTSASTKCDDDTMDMFDAFALEFAHSATNNINDNNNNPDENNNAFEDVFTEDAKNAEISKPPTDGFGTLRRPSLGNTEEVGELDAFASAFETNQQQQQQQSNENHFETVRRPSGEAEKLEVPVKTISLVPASPQPIDLSAKRMVGATPSTLKISHPGEFDPFSFNAEAITNLTTHIHNHSNELNNNSASVSELPSIRPNNDIDSAFDPFASNPSNQQQQQKQQPQHFTTEIPHSSNFPFSHPPLAPSSLSFTDQKDNNNTQHKPKQHQLHKLAIETSTLSMTTDSDAGSNGNSNVSPFEGAFNIGTVSDSLSTSTAPYTSNSASSTSGSTITTNSNAAVGPNPDSNNNSNDHQINDATRTNGNGNIVILPSLNGLKQNNVHDPFAEVKPNMSFQTAPHFSTTTGNDSPFMEFDPIGRPLPNWIIPEAPPSPAVTAAVMGFAAPTHSGNNENETSAIPPMEPLPARRPSLPLAQPKMDKKPDVSTFENHFDPFASATTSSSSLTRSLSPFDDFDPFRPESGQVNPPMALKDSPEGARKKDNPPILSPTPTLSPPATSSPIDILELEDKMTFKTSDSIYRKDNPVAAGVNGNGQLKRDQTAYVASPPINPFEGLVKLPDKKTHFPTLRFSKQDLIDIHDIKILEKVGTGSFAEVFRGVYKHTEVAVKRMQLATGDERVIQDFMAEVSLLRSLRHPNILLFMGCCREPLCLVTEFCSKGNLFDLLRSSTTLSMKQRINMGIDIAKGINFLHTSTPPIIHRDLKSLNLLLDDALNVKVSDFGLSRFRANSVSSVMTGQCGTYRWMSPEVIGCQRYTEKADVYSFGINLWELYTRQIPHEDMQPIQVAMGVLNANLRPIIPSDCPPPLRELIQCCWHKDPEKRPTFAEILTLLVELLEEPFVKG
eukprot:TRINITY_DN2507_c0_g5_i1.p1 TRINITY_DN2507_c0_g5~~TRINITY_DN2507_c0_g5_i1.p1  ORF type:complete len:1743 (+),score=567.30 TRINITY_DN2507_c0_g5_i1:97-5229(+)